MSNSAFNTQDFISLGIIHRTHYKDLPEFIFVKRDGLFVPFRSENISELIGEEGFVLRKDIQEEGDSTLTWQDLVGWTIEDKSYGILGTIDNVDESTINTLATLNDGRLLPLHEDFIIDIDENSRVLHVNLPFAL